MQLPDGQKAELGAVWLHGTRGHPLYELALQYGLMTPADLIGRVRHGHLKPNKTDFCFVLTDVLTTL